MSIQNKRIAYITDRLLKQNLQNGLLPDSKEFIWQFNQALKDTRYDQASFRFKPYKNTELMSSHRKNMDEEFIYQDLFVLYKNIITIHQLLNKQYQHFTIERDKLEKQLDILENRLRQFTQNAKRPGLLPYTYDTFDTVDKVDLSQTDNVFVDTLHNAVHLVEEKNRSARVFPQSDITFTVEPRDINRREEEVDGKVTDILNEKADRIWQRVVRTSENTQVNGQVTLLFHNTQQLNTIHLSLVTVKPLFFGVTYTPDGDNWYSLPYNETGFEIEKTVSLDFPTLDVLGFKFTFTKAEYDTFLPDEDGFDYTYLFGIEELAFYQKSYPLEGELISQLLPVQNKPKNYVIDTVQLYTDEVIPTGTQIEYAVALPGEKLDWQRIDPMNRLHPRESQTIQFHQLSRGESQELFVPSEFSTRQSEAEDLLKNGIPLYRLSNEQAGTRQFFLPKIQMLQGSTKLYVGKNNWEVSSFPSNETGQTPSLHEFQQVRDGRRVEYIEALEVESGDVFKNKTDLTKKKYMAKLSLFLKQDMSLNTTPSSTELIRIYTNGNEIFHGETSPSKTAHFKFRAGWNDITVLIDGAGATNVNGMTVSLGFNPHALASRLYASHHPLKEVSVFDLQYNTKMHDRTVFAKRETEEGLEILTNFAQRGLRFDLVYDYKDDFTAEEGIYFRARFKRDNGETIPTPILRQYRLEFS